MLSLIQARLASSIPFAFFTGAPGWIELVIVLAVLLILFGNRLPTVMRSLGQGITEFKKGVRDDNTEAAKIEDAEK